MKRKSETQAEYLARRRAYNAQWYDKMAGRAWEQMLQRNYGIDAQWYAATLSAQGGGCATCGKGENHPGPAKARRAQKPRRLSVDHCHVTKKVRGILCAKCNATLGMVEDSIERLRKLVSYLESFQ